MYSKTFKRWVDIALTVSALIILLPVIGIVSLLVRLKLGYPVIFCQQRAGLQGEPFTLYKFRTMTDAQDAEGNLLHASKRLTPLGRFLRSTSLDELPQLWNVLKGDMSLVGPRPLLVDYLSLYTEQENRRHNVMPGITGWAQVKGRNAIAWEEKFALDVWYVDNISFWLDLKILALTAWRIVKREGVSPGDREIMPRFTGSQSSPEKGA